VASDTARLFFAAWPDAALQRSLHAVARHLQRECSGRATAAQKLHLTLAFLGEVPRADLERLAAIGAGIGAAAGRCTLNVDRLGYWRHNRILWAGTAHCPAPLVALARALGASLRESGYPIEDRDRPYVPHLTLLRGARRAPARSDLEPALPWPVGELALVESAAAAAGRSYRLLRRWPLAV